MIAWLHSLRRRVAAALPWRRCACQGPHHVIEIYPGDAVQTTVHQDAHGAVIGTCTLQFARAKVRCCQCGRISLGVLVADLDGGARA